MYACFVFSYQIICIIKIIFVPLPEEMTKHLTMMKITILRQARNTQTLRMIDLEESVTMIQDQAFGDICRQVREVYIIHRVCPAYASQRPGRTGTNNG